MDRILKLYASKAQAGEICETGGKKYICAYFDAVSPASIAAGDVLAVDYDNADGSRSPRVSPCAALAVYQYVCVAQSALTVAGWYWFQIKGDCQAKVEGTAAVAVGDYLDVKIAISALAFELDHAADRSTGSFAIAREAIAVAGPTVVDVYLIGDRGIIIA